MSKPNLKRALIQRFFALYQEYEPVTNEIAQLVDDKIINSGCLLVHGRTRNSHVEKMHELIGKYRGHIHVWDFRYHVERIEKDIAADKQFIADVKAGKQIPGVVGVV